MSIDPPDGLEDNSSLGLAQLLREDWATHGRSFLSPGLQALALHRIAVWCSRRPQPVRLLTRVLGAVNHLLMRNVYGIELAKTTVIGRRVRIGHHQGVVLGDHVVIGDDCLLRQNVTLGTQGRDTDQPRVGNGVQFGPGATVIGAVTIGDGARIGPGALVTTDVPAGATAFSTPARVMKPGPAR
jgi:serine O-acetyltransferase